MQDFDHADPDYVQRSTMVRRLLLEKNRSRSGQNWTPEQIQEVEALFPENPAMAKSVYRAIIDRLIDYESPNVVYAIDEFLNRKLIAEIKNESSQKILDPLSKNGFRWHRLLLGVWAVHGNLNLSLRQYGLLRQLDQKIQSQHESASINDPKIQMLPLLKLAFPGSVIATEKGALQMLAFTETGKSCCGHGCSGCFNYVVTTGLKKMGELKHSTLPLVQIILDRNNEP